MNTTKKNYLKVTFHLSIGTYLQYECVFMILTIPLLQIYNARRRYSIRWKIYQSLCKTLSARYLNQFFKLLSDTAPKVHISDTSRDILDPTPRKNN